MAAAASKTIRVASIQLGPISVEAGILGAVEDEDAGLVGLCTHGDDPKQAPARIKRRDYCPVCDNDDKSSFRKGKVVGSGVVLLDTAALESLAVDEAVKKKIELTVHPAKQLVAAFPSGKSYYFKARPGAANNYALLAELMGKRQDLAFVGEFSFGGAPALYQVQVDADGVLSMRQLARPETVRERPMNDGLVNGQYLDLAEQFADAICAKFEPEAYRDKRAEALARIIEDTAPVALADTDAGSPAAVATTDVGEALRAALAAMVPTQGTPAKKAVAKKAPAKRAVKKVTTLAS